MNQQKCIDLTMILKEVQDFDSLEFKQSLNIYKSSFPPNETSFLEIQMLFFKWVHHILFFISFIYESLKGFYILL